MHYMLLFLLVILYLFELIDIFSNLPVRVIGTGYRLLWLASWRPDRRDYGNEQQQDIHFKIGEGDTHLRLLYVKTVSMLYS